MTFCLKQKYKGASAQVGAGRDVEWLVASSTALVSEHVQQQDGPVSFTRTARTELPGGRFQGNK
jgi:hypothetical protein